MSSVFPFLHPMLSGSTDILLVLSRALVHALNALLMCSLHSHPALPCSCHTSVNDHFIFLTFLKNVYLFNNSLRVIINNLFERREHKRGRGQETGRHRIQRRLWAISTEPNARLKPTNRDIMTWAEVGCLANWATEPLSTPWSFLIGAFPNLHRHIQVPCQVFSKYPCSRCYVPSPDLPQDQGTHPTP